MRLIQSKKIIYGCESDGTRDSPYLTRYTLFKCRRGSLYLHRFHRSDREDLHCHPWPFWSVVLWPGYREVTPGGSQRRWPLVPAFRPATYRHRVQLLRRDCPSCRGTGDASYGIGCVRCMGRGFWERACYTLIWVGPRVREWGFFTPRGWQEWRDYFAEKGC